jgi:hypothetical protein
MLQYFNVQYPDSSTVDPCLSVRPDPDKNPDS